MIQVTIHQAKIDLSKLIQQALAGEEIIFANGNQPVAKLVALPDAHPQRRIGGAKEAIKSIAMILMRYLQILKLTSDRLLIAQVRIEEMTLLTAASHIQQYDVSTFW